MSGDVTGGPGTDTEPSAETEQTAADRTPGLGERLTGVSRRAFLRASGLGVAAVGAAAAIPGLPALLSEGESDAPAATSATEDGSAVPSDLVARVENASTGELHLYFGEQQVVVKDPGLMDQLARAAANR